MNFGRAIGITGLAVSAATENVQKLQPPEAAVQETRVGSTVRRPKHSCQLRRAFAAILVKGSGNVRLDGLWRDVQFPQQSVHQRMPLVYQLWR